MEQNNEVVYICLNNWMCPYDHPCAEPYSTWMAGVDNGKIKDCIFLDEEYLREHKLVVVCENIDMSINFCITAPKSWVLENCPSILDEYKKFLCYPDENGDVYGKFDTPFKEYTEDNIGLHWFFEGSFEEFENDDEEEDTE